MKGNIISVPIRRVEPGSNLGSPGLTFEGLGGAGLGRSGRAAPDPLGDRDFAITMRTPGQDLELAAGFLFTEGVINNAS